MKGALPESLRVNTVTAKNQLNELLSDLSRTKRPLIVEKRGKPIAVVIDYESYEKEKPTETPPKRNTLPQEIEQFHLRMKKKYPKGTGDSVEILREIRKGRVPSL